VPRKSSTRRKPSNDQRAVLAELRRTNRLLAGVIVQIARTVTTDRRYHIDVLAGLGLRSRQIAEALGTTEATVNTTKARTRKGAQAHSATTERCDEAQDVTK